MWNPSSCDCECNKACKTDKNLDIKNLLCKKRLIGKLVLECKEYTLNTTKTSPDDESVTCEKSNCPIHLISLVFICLLLLAVLSLTIALHKRLD